MKQLLKLGLAAMLLLYVAGCNATQTMFGFSFRERQRIKEAKSLIARKYELPDLLFYKSDEITGAGCSPGLVKDDKEYLPDDFPKEKYANHYLILLNSMEKHVESFRKDSKQPIHLRWHVPYKRPMVSTVTHEIDHTYFHRLSDEEKKSLIALCKEIDESLPEKNKEHKGHASYYSYFWSFMPAELRKKEQAAEPACAVVGSELVEIKGDDNFSFNESATNEQLTEALTYFILDHKYMSDDPLFQKKLNAYLKIMERFEKK